MGTSLFLKWGRTLFQRAALVSFAIFVLPILYAIEPFVRIRLRSLGEDRIGECSMRNEVFERRLRRDGSPPRTIFIYIMWNPANRQLADMWKRKWLVVESKWVTRLFLACQPLLMKTRFFNPFPVAETEHELLSTTTPVLEFTREEEEEGQRRLREMGVGPEDWFVCFHARDSRYFTHRPGFIARDVKNEYRNCSIENYLPAVDWIAEQGGFALRMGVAVETPLPEGPGSRIIDYATKYRSDFMDIYLSAKCRFYLGNSSGLICVPVCFNRPTAQANKVPLTASGFGDQQLFIPKLLRWSLSGEVLTFPQAHALGLFDTSTEERWRSREAAETYDELGLEWIENTAEDIIDLCRDMLDMIHGRSPDPEAVRLQEIYRQFHFGPLAGPYSSRIGPRFALRYRHLIDPSSGKAPASPQNASVTI